MLKTIPFMGEKMAKIISFKKMNMLKVISFKGTKRMKTKPADILVGITTFIAPSPPHHGLECQISSENNFFVVCLESQPKPLPTSTRCQQQQNTL